MADYIRPRPGESVLDLGCGGAEYLPFLGDIRYIGVDSNPDHIVRAKDSFGEAGRFICGGVAELLTELDESFEAVLCLGLLHYLDDDTARAVLSMAWSRVAPSGRLVAVDPVFAPGQRWLARRLAGTDSGRCVRCAYQKLHPSRNTW